MVERGKGGGKDDQLEENRIMREEYSLYNTRQIGESKKILSTSQSSTLSLSYPPFLWCNIIVFFIRE